MRESNLIDAERVGAEADEPQGAESWREKGVKSTRRQMKTDHILNSILKD